MVSAGYVPSVQLYNHLIQGFAAAGMEDEAFKVYWKMQEPITNFENVNFQSLCEVIEDHLGYLDDVSLAACYSTAR